MRKQRMQTTNVFLFIFWLTYFRPLILERFSSVVDNIWYIAHFLIFIVFLFYKGRTIIENLKKFKRKQWSNSYIFMLLFFVWNFCCVAFQAPDHITEYLLEVLHVIELVFVFKLTKREKLGENLDVFGTVSSIYIWLNFCSMIIFKQGIFVSHIGSSSARVQWLLGSKNSIPICILIFMIGVQSKRNYKNRRSAYITSIVGIISVVIAGSNGLEFMGGSSTGILACIAMFALFVYADMNKKNKKAPFFLSTKIDAIGIIAINIIILGGSMIPFISNLIVSVMHKTLDYSGRSAIWDFALLNISKSPIFGHGASKFGLNIYYESYLDGPTFTTYVYNMLLRLWLRYGIISVLLYFLILLNLRVGSDRVTNIVMAGILGICIFGLMNEVDFYNMFLPMIIIEEIASFNTSITNKPGKIIRCMNTY